MNLPSVGCRWNHDEAELFYQRKETTTARMTQNSVAPIFFKWSESTTYVIVVCLSVSVCPHHCTSTHQFSHQWTALPEWQYCSCGLFYLSDSSEISPWKSPTDASDCWMFPELSVYHLCCVQQHLFFLFILHREALINSKFEARLCRSVLI